MLIGGLLARENGNQSIISEYHRHLHEWALFVSTASITLRFSTFFRATHDLKCLADSSFFYFLLKTRPWSDQVFKSGLLRGNRRVFSDILTTHHLQRSLKLKRPTLLDEPNVRRFSKHASLFVGGFFYSDTKWIATSAIQKLSSPTTTGGSHLRGALLKEGHFRLTNLSLEFLLMARNPSAVCQTFVVCLSEMREHKLRH